MEQQFYTILTKVGKAKIANSNVLNTKLNLTKFQVGDGGGAYYNPIEDQTKLKNKVWEGNINSIRVDKDNPSWIVIEVVIPSNEGGFMIREAGIMDDEGNLIAVGKYPETFKPHIDNGSSKDLFIRMILEVSNTQNVTLKVDPTIIMATKKDIEVLESRVKDVEDRVEIIEKDIYKDDLELCETTAEITKLEDCNGGFINIEEIKGQTIVNLYPSGNPSKADDSYGVNSWWYWYSSLNQSLKTNTVYTQIVYGWNSDMMVYTGQNKEGTFGLSYINSNIRVFTTPDVLKDGVRWNPHIYSKSGRDISEDVKKIKIMLLEGDWSNKPIPQYFDGMKNVGEYKEESKAYKINMKSMSKNFVLNSNFEKYSTNDKIGWDNSKNGNLVIENWGSGYNAGVPNPTEGYHAHFNIKDFDFPVIKYINRNSEIGCKNRWLGVITNIKNLKAGKTYTISFDYYSNNIGFIFHGGIYHYIANNLDCNFYSGLYNLTVREQDRGKWCRYSWTFTTHKDMIEQDYYMYMYGFTGVEGVGYIRNVQLEENSGATNYEPFKEERKEVLLQESLKQWDKIKKDGLIEIGSKEVIFNGSEKWIKYGEGLQGSNLTTCFYLDSVENIKINGEIICGKLPTEKYVWDKDIEGITIHPYLPNIYMRVSNAKTGILLSHTAEQKIEKLKEYLSKNNINIIFETATQLIKNVNIDLNFRGYKFLQVNSGGIQPKIQYCYSKNTGQRLTTIENVITYLQKEYDKTQVILLNGWKNYDRNSVWQKLNVTRTGNLVCICGMICDGNINSGTNMAILPPEFRPKASYMCNVMCSNIDNIDSNSKVGTIGIDSSGNISCCYIPYNRLIYFNVTYNI